MPMIWRTVTTIHQQPRRIAGLYGSLGNPLGRQDVVEIIESHQPDRLRPNHLPTVGAVCHDGKMVSTSIQRVELDGGSMDLHVWTPTVPPTAAIIVIQEIFGVGEYIRAVAMRLAEAGYLVGAPDVFWRFAPGWQSDHSVEGLTASLGNAQQLDVPQAISDCVAAAQQLSHGLQADADGATMPAGVIGFCLGGTLAWGVAANGQPSVCVSYYGSGVPSMLGLIDQVDCPTLFHFGSKDAYIPSEGVEAVSAAIANRPGFVLNVESAGHAFDNHCSDMFYDQPAAQAAWAKTMAFLTSALPASLQ